MTFKKLTYFSSLILFYLLHACTTEQDLRPNNGSTVNDVWLIDKEDIVNWNSKKDNIQSIDTNIFTTIDHAQIRDDEKVYVYHHRGITKIYPQVVMGSHEISNDSIGSHYFALSYCPITASALVWNRESNGKINQYGVSGKLYRNNLVPYDRLTGSHWTQMGSLCVNGPLAGKEAETHLLLETTFSTIKSAYPNALVLDHHDCVDGICTRHKASNVREDPIDSDDQVLPAGSKYYGIVKDQSILLFDLELFTGNMVLFETRFKGQNLIIIGSRKLDYFAAFVAEKDSPDHTFFSVDSELPVVMADNKGNRYDMFGNIVTGSRSGERLNSPTAYFANTFAWDDFFSDIEIYQNN